jgi:hypothetical protein
MRFYPLFLYRFFRPWLVIASAPTSEFSPRKPLPARKVTDKTVRNPRGESLMSLATTKLTADDVRKAVELFWSTFLAKSEEELNDSYAPGSTVFQVAMSRSEPGRLGAMRRSREYFSPDTSMGLKLSPIDIVMCGAEAGVASYTFQFQAAGRDVGANAWRRNWKPCEPRTSCTATLPADCASPTNASPHPF